MTRLFVRPISSSQEEVPPVSEQIYDWSRKALSASVDDALDFVSDAPYVTGINCVIGCLQEAFRDVAVFYQKQSGVSGWLVSIRFEGEDLPLAEAHDIGLQFARNMWGDRFQCVISTCRHDGMTFDHILIHSVSFLDGRKVDDDEKNWFFLRHQLRAIMK
ncbi:MAG: hypothetical protein PUC71_10200 [Oscillospiraceae bacterium]|nr:hypothetical protein [Oscillospiraceae bacterium]